MLIPLTVLSAILVAAASTPSQDTPLTSGDVRSVHLLKPAGTRVEHFRLERGAPGSDPVGLVRWISGPDPEHEGGWRVEREVIFFDETTRVVHTERLHPDRRKLVWREVRPRSGRTLVLEWTPDGRTTSYETIGGEIFRKELDLPGGALLPLSLVEHARLGEDWQGSFPVFRPLASDFELLQLGVRREGSARQLELRRTDGLLVGRFQFRGHELESFRWQEGDLVARAISATTFRELVPAAEEAETRETRENRTAD